MSKAKVLGGRMKKIGVLGFWFFALKGLLWILVPWFVYYTGLS